MGIPYVSKRDREITKAAGFHKSGVHYGNDWFAKGSAQYIYLKKHFGSDSRWPRLPKGIHKSKTKKRKHRR